MVRRATEPEVSGVRFAGIERARPAPGVLEAIAAADVLVFAPSNPFVSIGPILAVPGIRAAIERTAARRAAVSPIIAGQAVKGPAAKMLAALGHEVSALGVARLYRGLVDVMVIDEADRVLAPRIEALGMRCVAVPTLMTDDAAKAALARATLEAASQVRRG
jgi:LPPG:FO 2-phospho-L-lactate transferase